MTLFAHSPSAAGRARRLNRKGENGMSTAYRLLVVEDEEPIAELLEYGLR